MSVIKYLKKISLAFFSYLPSRLKIGVYRFCGASIGKNVTIGFGALIIPFNLDFRKINIGKDVSIGDRTRIMSRSLSLGDHAQIKDDCRIWGESDFIMGKFSYIDQKCNLDLRFPIILKENVCIGGGSWLYTHGIFHSILEGSPVNFGPITIGKRAWVAANVFILPDITVGEYAIVGARSVVTKDVLPDSVVVGNPAREIAKTSEKTKKLTSDDKNKIVAEILDHFFEVYGEKVSLIEKGEKRYVLQFMEQVFAFIPVLDDTILRELSEKISHKNVSIISFNIPDRIINEIERKNYFWFDLEKETRSSNSNKNQSVMANFLGSYGIKIIPLKLK